MSDTKTSKTSKSSKKQKTSPKSSSSNNPKDDGGETFQSVNDKYKEMELRDHILLRPDSYVGGVDIIQEDEYVPESVEDNADANLADIKQFKLSKVKYCPAALKIFDEVIINARDATIRDKGVTSIKVDINRFENSISVWNNSTNGIPIEIMKKSGLYAPTSIFGKLLVGENFNDWEGKITGGRNGYGSKLCNIYSTQFIIDCTDTKNQKRFQQTFSNNMLDKTEPLITKYSQKEAYVKIKFYPDFQKLGGMTNIDDDFYKLLVRRVYDVAACTPETVKFYLNGRVLKVRTFEKYLDLFLGPKKDAKRVFVQLDNQITSSELDKLCKENQAERKKKGQKGGDKKFVFKDIKPEKIVWDVGVALSTSGAPKHTAYVNGIYNPDGGEHVNYILDKIVDKLAEYIKTVKKKNIGRNLKSFIRNNLWVFLNATVINPTFSGQTKRSLTTEPSKFFYKVKISQEFVEEIEKKCKITQRVVGMSEVLEMEQLVGNVPKRKKRKLNIPKLDDAKWAGTPKWEECTLIVTEGDSAKTLASSGLKVVGTEKYGVFPLRGKLLNLGEASVAQLKTNKEYLYLQEMLGLYEGWTITNIDSLRYRHVMIMSDQDLDGYHIKLLFMQMLRARFPDLLLKYPDFVQCFATPIVTATPTKKGEDKLLFFSLQDFEKWKRENPESYGSHKVKYLKGLGTSTPQDAVKYFENADKHMKTYFNEDDAKTLEAFDVAFSKSKINERKEWLLNYDENDVLDYSKDRFPYTDAINKELKHYSTYSYIRAIPRMTDGLKGVQRKIIWTMIRKGIWKNEKKVAQIKGMVSDEADYHHGENSIASAVVKLAQNYPGSNNLNICVPEGSFGSRLQNGDDASSDRYIFSRLEPCVEFLFDKRDNALLDYRKDDYEKFIEPVEYVTTIPLVLANGARGTGTGFSTEIPSFNPLDIIDRIKYLMDKLTLKSTPEQVKETKIKELVPWFREFKGTIEKNQDDTHYVSLGKWERVNETKIRITELPIGPKCNSFEKYKEWLMKHSLDNESKVEKERRKSESTTRKRSRSSSKKVTTNKYFIKDSSSSLTDQTCEYVVTFEDESTLDSFIRQSGKLKDYAFERTMQLVCDIHYTNMMLFDEFGKLKKYETPEEILKDFFMVRLKLYHQRKDLLLAEEQLKVDKITEKVRFLEMVISQELTILNQPKSKIIVDLEKHNFKRFAPNDAEDDPDRYKYLLSIPLNSVTLEKIEKFRQEKEKCLQELETLKNTTPKQMWLQDLENLEKAIQDQNKIVKDRENYVSKNSKKGKLKRKRPTATIKSKK